MYATKWVSGIQMQFYDEIRYLQVKSRFTDRNWRRTLH